MKNKTWKNYLGAAALVTVLFAGSVSAYFTDQDEKVNTFTVGKVTIELEEPKWENITIRWIIPGNCWELWT